MGESLEKKFESMQFSPEISKIYVPDTNVLIDECFSPLILSGNPLPDPEMNSRLVDLVRKTRKQYDNKPNDVIIYEIADKELDNLRHNPKRQDIEHEVRAAMKQLLDLKKVGELNYIDPTYTYSVLENKARVHFVSHDERYFQGLNLFDANNDDRVIRFIYELQKFLKDKCDDKRVIFVTTDINATDRAIKLGIDVEPFEFGSVSDPNQLYSGIARIDMSDKRYSQLFGERLDIETPRSIRKRVNPKNNQFLEIDIDNSKRFCMFVKDGRYIKGLKNYENFLEFLEKPDFSRIEEVLSQTVAKKNCDSSDTKSRIYRLLDKYSSQFKGREIARFRTLIKGRNVDDDILESLEREAESIVKSKGIELDKKNEIFTPELTKFRPDGEQKAWVELCCNTDIPVRSVTGPAGTGKTFWAIASGIYLFCKGEVDRIKYIKPLVQADQGLGYLKGDYSQKIAPWVEPVIDDQLELFCHYDTTDIKKQADIREFVSNLNKSGIVDYGVLTYISGRTITREFIMLDETHFIKRKHVELMIGRIGRNTYLNCLGDPKQAGAAEKMYVDEKNCGAVLIPDRLKGERLFGHISLPEDVIHRSEAARLASRFYR